MPLREIWNRSLCFPERKRTRVRRHDREQGSSTMFAITMSVCALCSARSTVAIRSSIRVPVNFICNVSSFLLRTRPCFVFSWPLRENSTTEFLSKIFTRHALRSPHREPGSFSGLTQTLAGKSPAYADKCPRYIFRPRASSRCATADCDQSLLRWPSPASSSAAGTSPASRLRAVASLTILSSSE